jgi:pyruvate ferredoxin oxidoreductase delta subunit
MGKIEFELNFCKGCGICANECPTKAITMVLDKE